MDISTLLHSLETAAVVVNRNCEGISHEESLIQPQGGHHNLNWVMGHIVRTRNEILELIGKQPLYPKTKFAVYEPQGFTPKNAVDMRELQSSFNALQTELEGGIQSLTEEKLLQPAALIPGEKPDDTVGSILATVFWHEAYHAGQLGIIRRVVGKPGVIKNPAGE